jgi:hypothetical protein
MNDLHRIIQVQEQTFRIGRQPPAAKSFLDTCDPDGLPWLLRSVDAEVAVFHQRMSVHWGWTKVFVRVLLTLVGMAIWVGGICYLVD